MTNTPERLKAGQQLQDLYWSDPESYVLTTTDNPGMSALRVRSITVVIENGPLGAYPVAEVVRPNGTVSRFNLHATEGYTIKNK